MRQIFPKQTLVRTITVEISRAELCVLQQALGLREMVQINATDLRKPGHGHICETKLLRNKILRCIRDIDFKNRRRR